MATSRKPTKQFEQLVPGTDRAKLVIHLNDYEWATGQYRAGRPLAEISDHIGVSRSQLFDYFSKNGVSRDLSTEIRNRTNRLLSEDLVDMTEGLQPTDTEQIIAINATLQAALIRDHRSDIRRMRTLALALLGELEAQTIAQDLYEDLGAILRAEDDRGRDDLNDAYKKVISTPGRTENLKKLAEILKILVGLERQAFGMRDDYEDLEIRRGKLAAATSPADDGSADDYAKIARRFQAVLDGTSKVGAEDATIVKETTNVPATTNPS